MSKYKVRVYQIGNGSGRQAELIETVERKVTLTHYVAPEYGSDGETRPLRKLWYSWINYKDKRYAVRGNCVDGEYTLVLPPEG